MSYLFFDIECANSVGGVCKMCSFGYIVTDKNLNVLEQKDIIINPESKFDWFLLKNNSPVKLTYPKKYYLRFKPFNYVYAEIKRLLQRPFDKIFGFAVREDLKYIKDATDRYKLDEIKFSAYDVRDIQKAYDNIKLGLKDSLELISDKEYKELKSHDSLDDAKMTMYLLKEMSDNLEVSVDDLVYLADAKLLEYRDKPIVKVYKRKKKKEKDPQLLLKNEEFNAYKEKEVEKMDIYNGEKFKYDFSVLIKKEIDLALSLVKDFYAKGRYLVRSLYDANFIVAKDIEDKERLSKVLDLSSIEILLLDELI